jgi:hypothetical protein
MISQAVFTIPAFGYFLFLHEKSKPAKECPAGGAKEKNLEAKIPWVVASGRQL